MAMPIPKSWKTGTNIWMHMVIVMGRIPARQEKK
jgi:hypothetical protein